MDKHCNNARPCYDDGLCHFQKECKHQYATHGDLFRRMSDEQLAVTLMCPNEMGMADISCDHSDDKNCCKCLLDWLQQPAEEGGQ